MERVKFSSINDITCGSNVRKSEKLIKEYVAGREAQDINDIIELYNVKKFFDNKIYLSEWTPDDITRYESLIKSYFGLVAKYVKSVREDNFTEIYNAVDRNYKDDYWRLIEKFKVYKSIDKEYFKKFINASKVKLYELLKHQDIIENFGEIVREYMLEDYSSAELLLDKFEIKHISNKDPLYFPKELSNSDKETIISNYINSKNPNLNYLRLIANIQSNKDKLELSPKTLLKAKRKAEEQEKQFFQENSGTLMETAVVFSKIQDEEVTLKLDGQTLTATYSKKWIEDNRDYATLLNNFIYLFEFVDSHMRCTLVNKSSNMSVFERFIFTSSQNAYNKGLAFDQCDSLSLLQLMGYYNELFSLGIRLEEVIEWFFKKYLPDEFNAHNFRVTMPSINSTSLEKCTNIMPALESVLKQFSLFVEEENIDFELLEIRSEHLIYKNIPSLIEKKYAYGIGDEYELAIFLLFSDQSMLGYSKKSKKSYESFFELLCHEKLRIEDYPDYYTSNINWLIEHQYLSINWEEYIVISNESLIMLLKDLYIDEVISYWKYNEDERKIIDELKNKNLVEMESSLFSRPEQDYINYFLNKSQFNNGLDLRNKYSHTQPFIDNNEEMHTQNYMIFLRLFLLTVIKINDDFCIDGQIKMQQEKLV